MLHLLFFLALFSLIPGQLYRLEGRNGRIVEVIERATPRWRRLAFSLNLRAAVVNIIEQDSRSQVVTACEKVLDQWMITASRKPVIWRTLIQALQESELNTLANDLELTLGEGTD